MKRKPIDEDKLALAFLLLAKSLHDQSNDQPATVERKGDEQEAA